MMNARRYVIVRENLSGSLLYFKLVALGMFWECTSTEAEARHFQTRKQAADVLIRNGKNREGWRVLATI
jgi:hypothetical protein